MKKIVLVNPWVLPVPGVKGGAIESLIDLLIEENEIANKCNLVVISVYDKEAYEVSKKYKNTKFIYIKTNFVSKVCQRLYGILKYHFFKTDIHWLFRYYYKAIKNIKLENPDLIIVEGGMYEQFIQLKKFCDKNKLVAYLHSEVVAGEEEQSIYGRAFAISEYIKKAWCRNGFFDLNKVDVIYNAVNDKLYKNNYYKDEKIGLKKQLLSGKMDYNNKILVMYSGRIIPEKGVYELAKAVSKMEDACLVIAGGTNFADSKKTEYLHKVCDVASQSNNIVMTGYIPKEELQRYYHISDVVCVPSRWEEPAALVTVEAMRMGKPLIVTKVGGMVEYVDPKCAIMVDNDENLVENLKIAIKSLSNNREKLDSMGKCSSERGQMFTQRCYYEKFIALCDEIISGR